SLHDALPMYTGIAKAMMLRACSCAIPCFVNTLNRPGVHVYARVSCSRWHTALDTGIRIAAASTTLGPMLLAHEFVASPAGGGAREGAGEGARENPRWMLFLHGILGRRSNWRSFSRRWVAARPGWGAVLVDLRGHGDS